jgi:GNAT superfamily N-acetyltransferase
MDERIERIEQLGIEAYDDIVRVWGNAGLTWRPTGRDSEERLTQEMARDDAAYFGAFVNERLVGVALATYDGRKGWINRVAVEPDYRRTGLARKLLDACELFLKRRGALVIACLIEEWNFPSMDLFVSCGYVFHKDIHYFSKRESPEA